VVEVVLHLGVGLDEAEAKALAMRADAYKQFNEAAIIQTVLAALPEIVRAAAEAAQAGKPAAGGG